MYFVLEDGSNHSLLAWTAFRLSIKLFNRLVEMKKSLWGLRVYQKNTLDYLVNWLRRSLNWNLLKFPEWLSKAEVVNTNSQYM